MQRADFEVKSRPSETASDGRQPSHLRRSGGKSPLRLGTSQTIGQANTRGSRRPSRSNLDQQASLTPDEAQGRTSRHNVKSNKERHKASKPRPGDAAADAPAHGATAAGRHQSPPRPASSDFLFSDNGVEDYARLQMERHMRNQHSNTYTITGEQHLHYGGA